MNGGCFRRGFLRCLEGVASDVAVLARQVTNLAIGRIFVVARGHFATDEGVQMGFGASAIAIRRNGLIVDVINWKTARLAA